MIPPGEGGGLLTQEYTQGEMFKSVGYNTTYVGKWHLGPKHDNQPKNQGYDQRLNGFWGSTDSTLYANSMAQIGMPKVFIEKHQPQIIEAKTAGGVDAVSPYTLEYRKQIEADIANASVNYIHQQAKSSTPFYLTIGWTRPHLPNDTMDEFVGSSKMGKYGDSINELDHHTGLFYKL